MKPPVPFFDTLQELANPFRQRVQSVAHLQLESEPPHAVDDYQFASEFLYSYRGSPDTFSTYRREIEHFLHWSWLVAKKSLRDIRREDIEAYVEFARKPPKTWIGSGNPPRYINSQGQRLPNPDWRPYSLSNPDQPAQAYSLSQSGVQAPF
jgi:hypothetical protein